MPARIIRCVFCPRPGWPGRFCRMGNGCGYRAEEKALLPFLYSKRLGDDLSADMVIAAVCRLEELGWSQS